jgi:hypothetical protein
MKISEIRKSCLDCISSCEEYEYRIIFNSNEEMGNEEGTDITISMMTLPNHVSPSKSEYVCMCVCVLKSQCSII